jgi:biopolymer transport protein ExbD
VFFKKRSKVSDEIPSSSMADIAFLLLIFFLTTTVFSEEKGLQLVLPEAQTEEIRVASKNIIHIFVNPDGSITVRRGGDPNEQFVELENLKELIETEIAENPKIITAVKVTAEARYQSMIDVLDELQLAESKRVSLQLLER